MELFAHAYLLLLAGGTGERLAPLSSPQLPKQFLRIFSDNSLIQTTVSRFTELIPIDRILVATNQRYTDLVREHLPQLPSANIIAEPVKKNTAPSLACAARLLQQRDPDALMIAAPTDHLILDESAFRRTLLKAITVATKEKLLVTMGVLPDRPESQYGYIKKGRKLSDQTFIVNRFVEKPSRELAAKYLRSGEFYWNSGIFVWLTATLLTELQKHLPKVAAALAPLTAYPTAMDLATFFENAESISIDHGIMEKSSLTAVSLMDCGWDDLGSLERLQELAQLKNLVVRPDILPYLRSNA